MKKYVIQITLLILVVALLLVNLYKNQRFNLLIEKELQLINLYLFADSVTSCKAYYPTFGVATNLSQFPLIYQAGFTYIEPCVDEFLVPDKCDSTFLKILAEKNRLNARAISCVIFLPEYLKVTGTEVRHDEIVARAEIVFRRAQMAEIPFIVFGSGGARRVPEGFSKQEATQQFIDLCKRLAPVAQNYNVTVVIEPLNSGETNFINSLSEGADIVRAVNHPNIQLLADIFHMKRENEPASEIVKYGKYIRHVHIAERKNRTAPGTSGDDFSMYFLALRLIKYTGCISIEGQFDDFETRIISALEYMKQQFK